MGFSEDIERVALQERELIFPRFDSSTAWELGTRLRAMAVERGLAVVIDVRRFGQPLFYTALEGTTPDNVEWVRRKCNVVARLHCSSYAVGLREKSEGRIGHRGPGAFAGRLRHAWWLLPDHFAGRRHRRQCHRLRPATAQRSRACGGGALRRAGPRLCCIAPGGGVVRTACPLNRAQLPVRQTLLSPR